MTDLQQVLSRYAGWGEPHSPSGENLVLGNRIGPPASLQDIERAWPDGVHSDAVAFWSVVGSADLFEDIEYGQWGMHILTPAGSFERTRKARIDRPDDLREDDVVIAEFRGDLELLILAPSEEQPDRRILVALELDKRDKWYGVGPSLAGLLDRYFDAVGDKYWDLSQGAG